MSFVPGPDLTPERNGARPPNHPPPPDLVAKALRQRKRSRERTQPTYTPPKPTFPR